MPETAGEAFNRIVDYRLGDKPDIREPGMDEDEPVLAHAGVGAWLDLDDEPPF